MPLDGTETHGQAIQTDFQYFLTNFHGVKTFIIKYTNGYKPNKLWKPLQTSWLQDLVELLE